MEKEEIPAELHYGSSDRIGDIVVAPELGWQFTDVARDTKGAHGYFPQSPDMQVMFRAIGPDFKTGYTAKGFVNVDIYPLLSYLLQIVPEKPTGSLNESGIYYDRQRHAYNQITACTNLFHALVPTVPC